MADAEYCVCCGEIIPEGRMVCPRCEKMDTERGSCFYRDDLMKALERCGKTVTIEKAVRMILAANRRYKGEL